MRRISEGLLTALQRRHTQTFNMAFLDFEDGPLHLHNSVGDIEWAGLVWQGVGQLGLVSESLEDTTLRPRTMTLGLNGLRQEWLDAARTEHHRGRRAVVYLAARSLVDGALAGDPLIVTSGRMDVMATTLAPGDASIQLTIEDERATMLRTPDIIISNAAQQARHPGDLACSIQEELHNQTLTWGPGGGRMTAVYPTGFGRGLGEFRLP